MNRPRTKNSNDPEQTLKVAAMILMFAGILLLAYGGYTYVTETDTAPNPLAGYVSIGDQTVSLPIVVGLVSIAIAAGLFFYTMPQASGSPRPPADSPRV